MDDLLSTINQGKTAEPASVPVEPAIGAIPATPPAAPRHVFLIDGSGFIFRAYFARARTSEPVFQRKSDGMVTEVVTLFSNMLDKYRRETDADHMAVVWDASGTSFRNRIYDGYKANRRETPDDLIPQMGHVRQAATAFDICQIEMLDFEADDLIATYTRHAVEAGATVTILSSDKDLMQLVGDRVTMRDPMSDRLIADAEVREKFGVGPDKVIDVQALCGDSVDNVPGVPGIGVKTAAELINAYGDLETLLDHAAEIKQPKRRQALIEQRGQGAPLQGAGQARRRRAAPLPAVRAQNQALRPGKTVPVSRCNGAARAEVAHRAAAGNDRTGAGRADRAGYPGDPAVHRGEKLRADRHARRARPLDRSGLRGRRGRDLAGAECGCRGAAGARRDRAGIGAGDGRLCPAWPPTGPPGPSPPVGGRGQGEGGGAPSDGQWQSLPHPNPLPRGGEGESARRGGSLTLRCPRQAAAPFGRSGRAQDRT